MSYMTVWIVCLAEESKQVEEVYVQSWCCQRISVAARSSHYSQSLLISFFLFYNRLYLHCVWLFSCSGRSRREIEWKLPSLLGSGILSSAYATLVTLEVQVLAWNLQTFTAAKNTPSSVVGKVGLEMVSYARQEAQLSQRGCATVSVIETLKCSLEVTQGHWKWHYLVDHMRLAVSLPL